MSVKIKLIEDFENSRPVTAKVSVKNKEQLNTWYMPFLKNGGFFVNKGNQELPNPGAKVFLLLSLVEENKMFTLNGKVVWLNHSPSLSGGVAGYGIAFDEAEAAKELKDLIEKKIAGMPLDSRSATF